MGYQTTFDAKTYFSNIANTLKRIAEGKGEDHFTSITGIHEMEGFLTKRQSLQGFQLVYVDNVQGKYIDNKSDNIINKRFHTFFVLINAPDSTYASKGGATDQCLAVVDSIISKMRYDRKNYNNMMERLDVSSIQYNQVGPIGQGWHGVSVAFFILDNPGNIMYDADDWN